MINLISDVSVCIISFNTKELLQNCLRSIEYHTHRVSYEVIVVDNNSVDGTQEMLTSLFPEVRTIFNSANQGFAKGTNQAVKIAQGKYVLLLNPDTVLLNDAIDKCVEFLKSKEDNVLVTCKILNSERQIQKLNKGKEYYSLKAQIIMHLNLEWIFSRSKYLKEAKLQNFDYSKNQRIYYAPGCFMLLKRSYLETIGYLDENFYFYSEDSDLSYRIRSAGGNIYYYPEAEIIHFGGESSKQVSLDAHHQFIVNRFKYYKKHFGSSNALAYRLILASGSVVKIVHLIPKIFFFKRQELVNIFKKNYHSLLWAVGFISSQNTIKNKK